ncbi:helix-hairpin-helix domain-containing protein [Roseiflexus sp.]|uniref:helix-hairpin-helix domain-containing protein n=1 Tax=Roseiflexus sp. TaxID=2562120 RepID=UPI00398ADD32
MTVRERLPPDNEMHSGERDDDTSWNERAAFRIAVESRDAGEGRLMWRTRAYHEEHDQHRVWTGAPDEALIEWIHEQIRQSIGSAVPLPVRRPPESTASAVPASDVPADDLQQIAGIGPAIARRLRAAGITTFAGLAACSLSDLAAWTGRSAEQITRMGWIERARALAYPAPPAGTPVREPPPTEASLVEAAEAEPEAMTEAPPSEMQTEPAAVMEAPSVEATIPESRAEAPPVEAAEMELPATTEAPLIEAFIAEPPATESPTAVEAKPVEETPIVGLADVRMQEALPSAADMTREAQEMMLEESPIVFAAILLDEEGEVQDVCLTTTGEQPPEWNDQQVARFFIETGTQVSHEAAPVSVHLNNVQIDTVPAQPGTGAASRLHATASVRLERAEAIGKQDASCHIFLLAYDLASGETHTLSATTIKATADTPEIPIAFDTDLPDVGRYQLLMAALLPEARALSAVSGPRLRVTP